jgi:hypothetical protein
MSRRSRLWQEKIWQMLSAGLTPFRTLWKNPGITFGIGMLGIIFKENLFNFLFL